MLLRIVCTHKMRGISSLCGRLSVFQGLRRSSTSTTPRTVHKRQQSCIPSLQCKLIIRAADERTVTRTLKVSSKRVSCFSASRKLSDGSRALHPSAYPTAGLFRLDLRTLHGTHTSRRLSALTYDVKQWNATQNILKMCEI